MFLLIGEKFDAEVLRNVVNPITQTNNLIIATRETQ